MEGICKRSALQILPNDIYNLLATKQFIYVGLEESVGAGKLIFSTIFCADELWRPLWNRIVWVTLPESVSHLTLLAVEYVKADLESQHSF